MRIVYDASVRAKDTAPPLNECLETEPPLQNQIWRLLVRGRFHAVAIARDIRKAFLQVRIREDDRDALRLRWIDRENPEKVRSLRYVLRLPCLVWAHRPFLLGGASVSITWKIASQIILRPYQRLRGDCTSMTY